LARLQVLTPPPETEVTVGAGLELVLTVSTIRSPAVAGETDRVPPVPSAALPTAEIAALPPLALISTPTTSWTEPPSLLVAAGPTGPELVTELRSPLAS